MIGKRLLIADDEPDVGDFIRQVAEEKGYEVVCTQAADEFEKTVETFDPTLIMLDIVMPDHDGSEILRMLAKMGCKARIIVMSGYGETYLESAKKIGAGFGLGEIQSLFKPTTLATLREYVDS